MNTWEQSIHPGLGHTRLMPQMETPETFNEYFSKLQIHGVEDIMSGYGPIQKWAVVSNTQKGRLKSHIVH